ncbi:MAG: hypothetical protein COA91_07290 [Robiginitomaculum sp.]|nr:MAG: hypothetical protein COA91_07290 [Robiginitomaculum sp.]
MPQSSVPSSWFSYFVKSLCCSALALLATASPALAENFGEALVSAYQKNPRLMAERARVREIDENYVQAQAAGRLTLNADATIARNVTKNQSSFSLGPFPPTTVNSTDWLTPHAGQLSIVQPIYQGGRVNGLKAQARAGILAARQNLRSAEQNLLLAAATAYSDVLRDEEAASIRRNNVRVLTQQKRAAKVRFDVGEGTRTDIAQADARMAAAEIGLANADASLAISRAAYVRYIGHIPTNLSAPPQFIIPPSLEKAVQLGRANHPQLIAARYNENAAQSAIHVARAAGRPILSLNATLQSARENSANFPLSESISIGAQLRIPLYQGGMNRSRVRAAKHIKTRTKFETRETELAVDQAVANLWAQVIASQRSLKASKKQVAAANIAFEGVQLEQQVGTRDTLDVLNAEQEVLDARLSVVQAMRNLNVASYQLLVNIGGFDAYALQLPVQHYDPSRNFKAVSAAPFAGYLPEPIEKLVSPIPDLTKNIIGLIDPALDKVGQDSRDLRDAIFPNKSDEFRTGDNSNNTPINPGTKLTDPDVISPKPILIITKTRPKTE